MKKYNKLVRDNIPTIIKNDGGKCKFKIADKYDFNYLLYDKLFEEVNEFIKKPCIEEIADILEVIDVICKNNNFSLDEIKKVKTNKRKERGSFFKRIFLVEATNKK